LAVSWEQAGGTKRAGWGSNFGFDFTNIMSLQFKTALLGLSSTANIEDRRIYDIVEK
jgi:hypothetical protein